MTPLLEDDRLTISLHWGQCAALWASDEFLYLDAWAPCRLELSCSRWVRLPGDLRLCGHLDFRDHGGRTWFEVVHWSRPPHPQCTHPGVLERREAALARHLFSWQTSLGHPRFAWTNDNNPTLLR